MTLPVSGPISIGAIATEFGGTAPHSLSEYYRGGGLVPDSATNSSVPTSGAISIGNFYGAANRVVINLTVSIFDSYYNLSTSKVSGLGYVAGLTDVVLTINSGAYIRSDSLFTFYALQVDTSWDAGDTVTIINNGVIAAKGGNGGYGAYWSGGAPQYGADGSPGTLALKILRPTTVHNAGTIAGGGGGGGGGGLAYVSSGYDTLVAGGAGGGGGQGRPNTNGGSAGAGLGTIYLSPTAGVYGDSLGPGAGGARGSINPTSYYSGDGGAGGSSGASGATGGNGTVSITPYLPYRLGRAGGSGGAAVQGDSFITWTATGTRLGAIT